MSVFYVVCFGAYDDRFSARDTRWSRVRLPTCCSVIVIFLGAPPIPPTRLEVDVSPIFCLCSLLVAVAEAGPEVGADTKLVLYRFIDLLTYAVAFSTEVDSTWNWRVFAAPAVGVTPFGVALFFEGAAAVVDAAVVFASGVGFLVLNLILSVSMPIFFIFWINSSDTWSVTVTLICCI